MRKRIPMDTQIELVMQCRQSGLSDYQWCLEHDIHPGTFYNWVKRIKKSGYIVPDSQSRKKAKPNVQEVVKVDLIDSISNNFIPNEPQNTSVTRSKQAQSVAAEIIVNHTTVRLFNDANPEIIHYILKGLGGSNDW